MNRLGLKAVDDENCVYIDGKVILFFYVGDVVLLSRKEDRRYLEMRRDELTATYEARDLGELKWFLNIRVNRDRHQKEVWLCQDGYVEKLVKKFNLEHSRGASTPLSKAGNGSVQRYTGKATAKDINHYQTVIGSLIYIAVVTRPDVAYAVSLLASQMSNPSQQHFEEARRVITYLRDTKFHAIEYGPAANINDDARTGTYNKVFDASSDAAFADDVASRKSTEGQVFCLFGGAIDWKSKRQPTVTKSTTEAELLSLSRAGSEIFAWKRLFSQLGFDPGHDLAIRCDNAQTVGIAMKDAPALKTSLRHVDIHSMWLRGATQTGQLKVDWIRTTDMIADGMTKSLGAQRHLGFMKGLGLVNCKDKIL